MAKLVPKLRFPEFNDQWVEKKFNDIYSFKPTNSYSRDNLDYQNGRVKNIHYGDIHTKFNSLFDIEKEIVPFVKEEINISRIAEDSYIKEGDLVIADASEDYNDIGKMIEIINLNNKRVLAGLHTFLARKESKSIITGFSSFLMKSWRIRYQIMRIAQGTKVLSLSSKRVADLKLIIPESTEQQKIISFLTAVDTRIKLLEKQKKQLTIYKKSIIQKLFSKKLRFKDDNNKEFPDWIEKKLGDITKIYDGTHQTPKYVDKGIPFYSVEHITANQFSNTKYISKEIFEKENNRVKVEKGDILMTRIGSIGVTKYIDWDVNASFYVSLALIKQNKSFNSKFISYAMSNNKFQKELWSRTIHVAFPRKINLGEIGECRIQLPSDTEQKKIADFLYAIDIQIEEVFNQIEETKKFKKGLLQQMFL